MSYGIHPFAVSIDAVKTALRAPEKPSGLLGRIFGARRKDLIEEMKARDPHILDDDSDDGFDDEGALSTEQALRDMLAGNKLNENFADSYGYALMALCWHFGEFQDNSHWSNMRGEWADVVDAAMRAAGIAENDLCITLHIMHRGMPVDIPPSFDFPAVGYILNAEIPGMTQAIAAANFSATEKEVQEAILAIGDWLNRARDRKTDLVFFYY